MKWKLIIIFAIFLIMVALTTNAHIDILFWDWIDLKKDQVIRE